MNESSSSENSPETEAIRSEIDTTRQRMDGTIDALAERLQPRHLVDEAIGYFRSKTSEGDVDRIKDKVTDTASTAVRGIVDTVKENPLPLLAIGAGVAWLIYSANKSDSRVDPDYERAGPDYGDDYSDYDYGSYRSNEYASENQSTPSAEDVTSQIGENASDLKGRARQKVTELTRQAKERLQAVRDRAGEIGSQVQGKTQQAYDQGREKVSATVDRYPLGIGLGCLAAGLVAGLLIPTPERVNRSVGPAVDRVRRRARETGRDIVDRGRHVVHAAADAMKREAEAQGLTPEALRQKASAVAGSAKQAATDTARKEGLANPSSMGNSALQQQQPPTGNPETQSPAF